VTSPLASAGGTEGAEPSVDLRQVLAAGRSYGTGRLHVECTAGGERLRFSDRLQPGFALELPTRDFEGLAANALDRELLRRGFMRGALPAALRPIADRPREPQDLHYWQFPARTEAAAHAAHAGIPQAHLEGNHIHVYLGLPWATWIDYRGVHRGLPDSVEQELAMQRIRLQSLRRIWNELGCRLRVHTVCQHIHWRRMIKTFKRTGITDIWLSHAPPPAEPIDLLGLKTHPWRLFAVNVEDTSRRRGLEIGKDPASKPLLASFIGAHQSYYLCDIRERLLQLAGEPGFLIEVNDRWHFHEVVYEHQMRGKSLGESYRIDDTVERYNRILSDSVFSLCPSGSGPNSIRLWESLAVGAIPVLLGVAPELPERDREGRKIRWNEIVIRAEGAPLDELAGRLRAVPVEELRRRSRDCRKVFDDLAQQRCFGGGAAQ
jgi:hypothetical protein